MSVFMWRVIAAGAAGMFLIGLIVLLCARFLKNKYYHNFTLDEKLRTVKTTNSRNTVYLTSGETNNYIKKYVICKSAYDKYLVCNFKRKFSRVGFFVIQYSASKRVISVLRVTQTDTNISSRVISLKRQCKYVNVVISYADGADINAEVIRPIPVYKLRMYAFFKSMCVFTGLFVFRHVLIELLGGAFLQPYLNYALEFLRVPFRLGPGTYVEPYLNHFLDYAAIGGSFLLSLINYWITVACFRHKGAKERSGGALEYEFV